MNWKALTAAAVIGIGAASGNAYAQRASDLPRLAAEKAKAAPSTIHGWDAETFKALVELSREELCEAVDTLPQLDDQEGVASVSFVFPDGTTWGFDCKLTPLKAGG